ncbi:MAG: hypothetical protein ABJK79_10030 [Sulfitobacter pontiacus]|uniref:gp53-like domain-containing protein n=1 Tax=Sulfitobacter pontiacus TaxID=60137 RepID=UPI003297ABC6
MATPTITPMQTPFPDKGQSQAAFDYNVDGLMNLFDSMTTELPVTIDWMQDRVNEVAATAIGGDLPDITGQATNMIRHNEAGTAAEFRTPAQVVQDLGSGTAGRAVFAAETPEDGRTALGVATVIDEDDMASESETRPPSQQSVKAYADGESSFGTSGYHRLPSGLIVQWGQQSVASDGTQAVSWPLTFPTSVFQAFACLGSAFDVTSDAGCAVYNITTSGATLRIGAGGGTFAVRYFAVGR